MSQNALMTIARDAEMTARTLRVFLALCAHLDFENYLVVNQRQLAKEIGLHPSDVNREIRKLVAKGVLVAGPRSGRSCTYRLNPAVGWRGSARAHRRALDEARTRWTRAELHE